MCSSPVTVLGVTMRAFTGSADGLMTLSTFLATAYRLLRSRLPSLSTMLSPRPPSLVLPMSLPARPSTLSSPLRMAMRLLTLSARSSSFRYARVSGPSLLPRQSMPFLIYLKPGQARSCGEFCARFSLVRRTSSETQPPCQIPQSLTRSLLLSMMPARSRKA